MTKCLDMLYICVCVFKYFIFVLLNMCFQDFPLKTVNFFINFYFVFFPIFTDLKMMTLKPWNDLNCEFCDLL